MNLLERALAIGLTDPRQRVLNQLELVEGLDGGRTLLGQGGDRRGGSVDALSASGTGRSAHASGSVP